MRDLKVLLFANGELKHGAMVKRLLASLDTPLVICADGGALHARALGFAPHAIIGDLDSLTQEQVARFRAERAEIIQHPREKDETDLELALRYCQRIGAKSIHILGALGGRFDQTMANILLLALPEIRDIDISLADGDQIIRLLQPGEHRVSGAPGDTISLLPLSAAANGITTRGLKYPLRKETLRLGPARGISNVMLEASAAIEFARGTAARRSHQRTRLMTAFTVIKLDARGNFELSYDGVLRERADAFICIEAEFQFADRDLGYVRLRRGDLFREWFYRDRYFNIFRIQDVDSSALKGWYCNITRPPLIEARQVSAEDLCLDVFVYPDGRALLLDEDDFARLNLPERDAAMAWRAVAEIRRLAENRLPPFDEIRAEQASPRQP